MKFLGMGVPELLIILVVILLIFGPKNLPKLGSALGKTVKNLREGIGGGEKKAEAIDADAEDAEDAEGAPFMKAIEATGDAEEEPAPTKKRVKKAVKASA